MPISKCFIREFIDIVIDKHACLDEPTLLTPSTIDGYNKIIMCAWPIRYSVMQ